MTIEKNKQEYIELLRSVDRVGMEQLIKYIEGTAFFTQPASARFHLNVDGGLCEHSLNVYYDLVGKIITCNNYELTKENKEAITIAALCHDLCKHNNYEKTLKGFKVSRGPKNGHSKYSLVLIKKHIILTALEEAMIKYHMGLWHTNELARGGGEYSLYGLISAWNKMPLVQEFHASDNYVSKFIEK